MEWISGTRVSLGPMRGTVVLPEPWQTAPGDGRVLIEWDERRHPVWEYAEDLTADE